MAERAYHPSVVERFWTKVDRSGGPDACWPWTAGRFKSGYGGFHPARGVTVTAHRFAYETACGPVPNGLHIDHVCHNADPECIGGASCPHRACVNPKHLEPVEPKINVNRSHRSNRAKTHCPAGHAYTPENTYYQVRPTTRLRKCRTCAREWGRRPQRAAAQRRRRALKKGVS